MVLQDRISLRVLWKGRTPLQIAIAEGHKSIVQLLLGNGAEPAKYNPHCYRLWLTRASETHVLPGKSSRCHLSNKNAYGQ